MLGFIKKIFGTKNDREIKRIEKSLIQQVYAYADQLEAMSDDELRGQTRAWQEELGAIEDVPGASPCVSCPRHGWCIELGTGYCEDVDDYAVRAYDVLRLADGRLCVSTAAKAQG